APDPARQVCPSPSLQIVPPEPVLGFLATPPKAKPMPEGARDRLPMGQDRHVNPYSPTLPERPGDFARGRAGCQHVIDEQYGPPGQRCAPRGAKCPANVGPACRRCQIYLRGGRADATDPPRTMVHSQVPSDGRGHVFALVIPPP